jgi:hypothetical protein
VLSICVRRRSLRSAWNQRFCVVAAIDPAGLRVQRLLADRTYKGVGSPQDVDVHSLPFALAKCIGDHGFHLAVDVSVYR